MTSTYGPQTPAHRPPDPLTDSGIHRIGLGTQVRLYTHGGHIDCGLLDVAGVSTWTDLVHAVIYGQPIEVTAPVRHAFAGGVVLHVECLSDIDRT